MWHTTIHLLFSLSFWGLWFLLNMKYFYPFQMLCFYIEIKFNDIGLVIKLQNSFENLKLGFDFIIFLIYNICSLWLVKNYNCFSQLQEKWFLFILLWKVLFLEFGFVFLQTMGTTAVWTRVPPAGSPGGLGCLVCRWPQPKFSGLYLHSHVTLYPRCL